MKVYFAKDIHNIKRHRYQKLILGGLEIDNDYSIQAHSDGDIIIHTITSCLLASTNQKTLGEIFLDTKSKNKDRSSIDFLNYGLMQLHKQKKIINNIDLTIVCEKIILKDYLMLIQHNLIKLCKTRNITIKATRFENGHNKQIECYCVLTIK